MAIDQENIKIIEESRSKQETLQDFINWINERVFGNRYILSKGVQLFHPTEFANFNKLTHILDKHLNSNKKYYYKCLDFVPQYANLPISEINFEDLETAVRLMEDELIELALDTESTYKENYVKYKKILFARYNNYEFDNKLVNILYSNKKICGIFFRYVLNMKLEDIDEYDICDNIADYINTHNTVEIINALEEMKVPPNDIFLVKLKELISSSIEDFKINICFDSILGVDSIAKVLMEMESKTSDQTLNELIRKAKDEYIKGDIYNSICTLWDIFERIKTMLDPSDKKKSAKSLIELVGNNIFLDNQKAVEFTITLFDKEFKDLTDYGNEFNIRHSEVRTFDIHDKPELLSYFIKRTSALLELFLPHAAKNN